MFMLRQNLFTLTPLNLLSVHLFFRPSVRPAKSPCGPKGPSVAAEGYRSPQELEKIPPQEG